MDVTACVAALPPHLGWGSATVTAVVRAVRQRIPPAAAPAPLRAESNCATPPAAAATPTGGDRATVKLYPSLALGMLREKQTTPGRLWLLLRHLDGDGRGWLRIATIREQLTRKHARLRLCGWRQLRNVLRQGQGLFWTRDAERIWLCAPARVAAGLQVARLHGWPVALPVDLLLQPIGTVRAHFYASFHTGRRRHVAGRPIARATLARISGVGRRSQRAYEARAGLSVQPNYAIGDAVTTERAQWRGWTMGRALFYFRDGAGRQGQAGRTYLAWQLPNSYGRCHQLSPRGRQKRINRELTDLFAIGMTGNDQEPIERRYFTTARQAAAGAGELAYWPAEAVAASGCDIWHVF